MAWIESHQELVHHPKLFKLISLTGWRSNEAIGTLHRLWWWTLAYAESGYLGDHQSEAVSMAIDAQITEKYGHENLFSVLTEAEFMTKNFFIWDWLDYAGRYLKTKYHTSNPDKFQEIIDNFDKPKSKKRGNLGRPKGSSKSDTFTYLPTYLNQPTEDSLRESLEEMQREAKNDISSLINNQDFVSVFVKWTLFRKKELNKKMTPSMVCKQIDKLTPYGHEVAITTINDSMTNGYQGLFPEKHAGASGAPRREELGGGWDKVGGK